MTFVLFSEEDEEIKCGCHDKVLLSSWDFGASGRKKKKLIRRFQATSGLSMQTSQELSMSVRHARVKSSIFRQLLGHDFALSAMLFHDPIVAQKPRT